jgi:putative phage-type endonuclease
MQQGTPEWFKARCGKATASRIADIVAKTKSGYSASRANYAAQLVAERLTGAVEEGFSSAAMKWGTENEDEARNAYAFRRNLDVSPAGFIPHPNIGMAGASPDGFVGDDGLVEIKCPNTATHIDTLVNARIPLKYHYQMQWQMACTGRAWCDFVSFDPRLPESMRLFVARLLRDEDRIAELENEVAGFLREVDATVLQLSHLYEPEANPLPILMAG